MSGLVTCFERSRREDFDTDPLGQAVDAFLKNEGRGESLLFSFAIYCETFLINVPSDLIQYYHFLISILFLRKFYKKQDPKLDRQIKSLMFKGRKSGFGKNFYLQKGYEVLSDYLFNKKKGKLDFKQLEKGAILYNGLSHPLQNGEMGLIVLYLGLIWNDDNLLHKGLKCIEFSLSLYDHRGKFFQGVWLKEIEYRSINQSEVFVLLFNMASRLFYSVPLTKVVKSFSQKSYSNPFIILFNRAFEELSFYRSNQKLILHDVDRSLGFFRYQYEEMSVICSASGKNTGLGSIHKQDSHIVSMGPHYTPLADSDYYGIFRLSSGSGEGFKDLKTEVNAGKTIFNGWTRIFFPERDHQNDNWLFFNLECEKDRIDLTIRKSHHHSLYPLFYVFFVSADKAILNEENELYPGTLDRYQGKAHQVLFKRGKEMLKITPRFNSEMALIPLSEKDHFWSANFLLTFALNKKLYPYCWTVN